MPGIDARLSDAYRNFRRSRRFLQHLVCFLRIVSGKFNVSIHDHLGSVRGLQSKSADISCLAFGQCRGGVRIFPAVMIPIIHVFAEHDELRTTNRRGSVHPFEEGVRRRTTGTAFRREQLNENGMKIRARSLGARSLVFGLQTPPVGGRRSLQKYEA